MIWSKMYCFALELSTTVHFYTSFVLVAVNFCIFSPPCIYFIIPQHTSHQSAEMHYLSVIQSCFGNSDYVVNYRLGRQGDPGVSPSMKAAWFNFMRYLILGIGYQPRAF